MPSIDNNEIVIGIDITATLYDTVNGSTNISGKVISIVLGDNLSPASNASENHVNIYPSLPAIVKETTEDDYTSYTYIAIKDSNDVVTYIGLPWITLSSVTRIDTATLTITLDDFPENGVDTVKAILTQNGYSNASYSLT